MYLPDEDPSTYMNIQGVTSIEIDTELHIDLLNNDQVKKYIDEIDIERSESRRLQEQRPWGIDLVNVTHLWDVSVVCAYDMFMYAYLSHPTHYLFIFPSHHISLIHQPNQSQSV